MSTESAYQDREVKNMVYKSKSAINKSGEEVTWNHPGGKLLRLGPEYCSDTELLTMFIGSGTKEKSALEIAEEIIEKYHSLRGLMGVPLDELMKIKGLKKVRAVKIASAFEIARRIVKSFEKE